MWILKKFLYFWHLWESSKKYFIRLDIRFWNLNRQEPKRKKLIAHKYGTYGNSRCSCMFGLWESDVTSGLFLASQGYSMADTGAVEALLQRVEKVDDGVDSLDVATSLGVDHQVIVGAVKSLQALGDVSFTTRETAEVRLYDWCNKWSWHSCLLPGVQVISADLRSSKHWELTEEGTEIAEQGSHEARVFGCIPLEGLAQSELMVSVWGGQVDHRGARMSPAGLKPKKLMSTWSLFCV